MKKLLAKTGVFTVIILAGLTFSFLCFSETNITSLLAYQDRGVYTSYVSGPLGSGKSIRGEFRAVYDNLGMVKLRIRTFNRINTTHIRFQIWEKGKSTVLATNEYALDRFEDSLLYPFGFPVIADSKGKSYEFTLESVDGTSDNAVGIVSGYHDVATQYVFQKSEILVSREKILSFFSEKAKSILFDPYMIFYIIMFLVPAFVYLIPRGGEILAVYALLTYTYLPLSIHSNTILVIAAFVFGIALFTRAAASRIYLAACIWLVQIPVMIAIGNMLAADKAATLIFFFILIGGIISLTEFKKK